METHFKTNIVMLTHDDRQHGHVVVAVVPVVVPSARSQKPQSNGAATEMGSRELRRLRLQYHDPRPSSYLLPKVPVTSSYTPASNNQFAAPPTRNVCNQIKHKYFSFTL